MATDKKKSVSRLRRKRSIRKRINGTNERPRLSVYRSNKHIYAQIIDDVTGETLVSASTQSVDLKDQLEGKNKSEKATLVGQLVSQKSLSKEISTVVFDRNGFIYHGRVKAVADGAREGGLAF
jgi:large subunit ribosomal protein L18